MAARFDRPPTPPGFDASRAAERAADPHGWRFDDLRRRAVYDVIARRRDIRRFRPDRVDPDMLERILDAAHSAPSVGLMQPWRLIVISELSTRSAIRRLAQRERLRQAARFDDRAGQFLDQKIEGIVEAPLGICVCCDHGDPDAEILGRGSIPATDVYSTACAIENLWLAARAEGLGVGWVSFYQPAEMASLLDLPQSAEPIAYLCVGWPDERPTRPGLEANGWSRRMALSDVVMRERWGGPRTENSRASAGESAIGELDRAAAIAARDHSDALVKPTGSLGVLETVIDRWALVTGAPPPATLHAGILVCAADHGHVIHGTSLFDGSVSAQIAAAAARGETAVGVLAARGGHALIVADVGLAEVTPTGVRDLKVARGCADMTAQAALDQPALEAAMAAGAGLVGELADRGVDCLVLGEIGIGNTTTAAALACTLAGLPVAIATGRGTGVDAAGWERKRGIVAAALARHGGGLSGRAALAAVGGLEFAALAGAVLAAFAHRLPVLLDGYAVSVAALAAVSEMPVAAEILFASHRSAEPGHGRVLDELGLEPLLDLRLRLGEASGALLALPLIAAAGALHQGMGTFAEAGIARAR